MTDNEIKALGVKPENICDGKMYGLNIIVRCFGHDDNSSTIHVSDEDEDPKIIMPTYYLPRKERCYGDDEIDLNDEKEREEYLSHLRDSQERLKILAALLHQQEKEIEQFGYPKTTCYYPTLEALSKL